MSDLRVHRQEPDHGHVATELWRRELTSVVIAAFDEAAVIGSTLDSLLLGTEPDELEVVVVANGCRDDTAAIAALRPGVLVVELAEGSKPRALDAGDAVSTRFPRVYLDADIRTTTTVVRALTAALSPPGADGAALAAVPRRMLDLRGRSLPVRAYFAIHSRLPAVRDGLYGRGMIALSEAGRSRFDHFPDAIADDLFLDSLFTPGEVRHVEDVAVVVETPRRTSELVRRLVRVRRGNAALRAAQPLTGSTVRRSDRWAWLRDVVLPRPWLAPAGVVYIAITVLAGTRARRTPASTDWGREPRGRPGEPHNAASPGDNLKDAPRG